MFNLHNHTETTNEVLIHNLTYNLFFRHRQLPRLPTTRQTYRDPQRRLPSVAPRALGRDLPLQPETTNIVFITLTIYSYRYRQLPLLPTTRQTNGDPQRRLPSVAPRALGRDLPLQPALRAARA